MGIRDADLSLAQRASNYLQKLYVHTNINPENIAHRRSRIRASLGTQPSNNSSQNSSSNQAQTKNPPKRDRDKPTEVNLELDPNKLIEYTNQLFLIHYNKGLNSDSKHILIDLWSNKDYQEIESSRGIKTKAIRKITSNLFEHLSNALGEKVHLRNLREVMNKHYRAYHSLSR